MEVAITCGGFGSFFFFFFQAEDGIRDKLVTGVQTCALPISPPRRTTWRRLSRAGASSSPAGIRGVSAGQIGRASCRGRGEISGGAVSFKKKKKRRCWRVDVERQAWR